MYWIEEHDSSDALAEWQRRAADEAGNVEETWTAGQVHYKAT